MYCTKCGAELDDEARFCIYCGARVGGVASNGNSAGAPASTDATQVFPAISSVPPSPERLEPQRVQGAARHGNATFIVAGVCAAVAVVLLVVVSFLLGRLAGTAGSHAPSADTIAAVSTEAATTPEAETSAVSPKSPASVAATTSQRVWLSSEQYVIADSGSRYLSAQELRDSRLSADSLWLARNEIYARYGRGFADPELQNYFDYQPWYVKLYTPEEFDALPDPLNVYEKANVDTIKEVERELGSTHL